MSIRTCKTIVVLAFVGWSSCFAIQQPLNAGGQIVPVTDPLCDNCDACGPTRCQAFCHKLRLHGIYARRCLSQKYVLLPTSPAIAPYVCPAPNAGVPPYASPYGQSTIGGYSSPPPVAAPAGVFIR